MSISAMGQVDLALGKSVSVDSAEVGDTVVFTLTITNEGGTDATNVFVADTLPAQVDFLSASASNGSSYNPSTGLWDVGDIAAATSTVTLTITTRVNGQAVDAGVVRNVAEISSMFGSDDDSTPNNRDYNEDDIAVACFSVPVRLCAANGDSLRLEAPAGLSNYQWFDGVTLVGTDSIFYATDPGRYTWTADSVPSGCPLGSCRPVIVEGACFDLALYKELAPGQALAVEPGDLVTFRITVVNQGDYAADSIQLIDYIPALFTLEDAGWTAGGSNAVRTLNAGDELPAGGLAPGNTASVDIALRLSSPVNANTTIVNWAEIASARDALGNAYTDIDSTPDSDDSNDTYLVDNLISDDGKNGGDEDDHDRAHVVVEPFDLALYKELAPGQSPLVKPGDLVTFRITVVNQGSIAADNIQLIDYIPADLSLDDADWSLSGSNAVRTLNSGDELPGTGLQPSQSVQVEITLEVLPTLGASETAVNWAEIASATDDLGNAQTDVDSDPNTLQSDDTFLSDDYIDGDGKNGGDEDDHDKAEVQGKGFDLALWKALSTGQSAMVEPGDTVSFDLHVVNQGMIPADSIWLVDYLGSGLSLADAGWSAGSGNTALRLLERNDELPSGGLLPDSTVVVRLRAVVGSGLAGGTVLENWAEISSHRDADGNTPEDTDSTPDSDDGNDTYLVDNHIDGNGKAGGDEDDHDGATLTVKPFDLALYKILGPGEDNIVEPGDEVVFQIVVVNQGMIAADNILIRDSIPTGMTLMDASWTFSGNIASRTLDAGDELPVGGLQPGEADTVAITFKVPNPLPTNTRLTNWAEIASATDAMGVPSTDVDSDFDSDLSNDKFLQDDYIDGNGHSGGDEDDHDAEDVMYEVFDLALRKTVDDTEPIAWGDDVTFTITLFNQGTIPAQDIELYEWLPDGFEYSANDFNGWTFAGSPSVLRMKLDDLLQPGDSLKVKIVLTALEGFCLDDLYNTTEITSQEDQSGANMNDRDIDSTPDKIPSNDTVEDDVITGDAKNMPGDDEDDHDTEAPPVFDLALRLTTAQTLPVRIGDEVTFTASIFNQGNIGAQNVELKATLPTGFTLSAGDANGWTDNGDGTLSLLLTDSLLPGEALSRDLLLLVGQAAHEGDLTLHAEIQGAEDLAGNDRSTDDLDSTPDMNPANDPLQDDEINSCGQSDEDDHDIARVDLFDLALRKTIADTTAVQWFEDAAFTITLFNQSPSLSAQNIEVVDYIPAGFVLSPNDANGWTDNGDGTASRTVAGPIAPGDSIQLHILLQVEKYTPAGLHYNYAEITAQEDDAGRDLSDYDFDSVPDDTLNNDQLSDDIISEHGRVPGQDEDDHDLAPVKVEIIDLALRKTTAQTEPVLFQQDVDFTITLFNQGSRALQDLELVDYVPAGFKLSPEDPNGWTFDAGLSRATVHFPGTLQPGDSAKVHILLRVQQGAAPYTFGNRAEITAARDDAGQDRTGDDVDSDWDENPDNDTLLDDVIDQDATVGGDEDDHDIAGVRIFDLALRKTTPVTEPVTVRDDVPFSIEIFNQGMIPASQIELVDYLPPGFALSPADANGWTDNGDGTLSLTYGGTIAPQSSALVNLLLRVQPDAVAGLFENGAEIRRAEDDQGNDRSAFDVDSDYDALPDNDAYVNDEINDDGDFDEDDHDRALVEVEIIDLALRKVTQFQNMEPVRIGEDVHFAFEIFNQGSVAMQDIQLVDYLPAGFLLSPTDGNGWTAQGDSLYLTVPGPLAPGEALSVGLVLRVSPQAHPDNLVNAAEIFGAADEDGDPRIGDDRDSDGDQNPSNDAVQDDIIDQIPPTDEDDHDIEGVPVFDLALRKTTSQSIPVTVGDDVLFHITLFNQGTIAAGEIGLVDYLPPGFVLSPADANGWNDNGDGTASLLVAGPLAPGDSMSVDILLRVQKDAQAGVFFNAAEITFAQDTAGVDRTDRDLDSTPDTLASNDPFVDDLITDNGSADEDDHDRAPVEVEIIDLAVRKTTDFQGVVDALGQDVLFEIEIFNQGSVALQNIELRDFLPPGFVLSPADANGWTDNGDGTASLTLADPLQPGLSQTTGIVLRLDSFALLGPLDNVVEIQRMEDLSGTDRTQDDRDSQADDDPDNDPLQDDEVNDQGTTDEDDHDIAGVFVDGFDLALIKQLDSPEPYFPGDTLRFRFTVINQGTRDAFAVRVVDSLPPELLPLTPDWLPSGDKLFAPAFDLPVGDTAELTLEVRIDPNFMDTLLVNSAEIASADDDTDPGNAPPFDIDSQPDSTLANDVFGGNDLTDGSNGDEDDHDRETLEVTQIFDLALYKKPATGQNQPVEPGDTVRFTIVVLNQGTLNAYDIVLKDYLPADLLFSTALNTAGMTSNTADWSADTTYTIAGPLSPGDSVSVDILLVVDENTLAEMVENTAEIASADNDTDTGNTPPPDADSTPDDQNDDFVGGDNFVHNENGDEDDHDIAVLALVPMEPGTIAGQAWKECDADGVREGGEDALPEVLVTLTGTTLKGDPVQMQRLTASDGTYRFEEVDPGTYTLLFSAPNGMSGLEFVPKDAGGDDALDSDAHPATGGTDLLVVMAADSLENVDVGFFDAQGPVISPKDPAIVGITSGDTLVVECDDLPPLDESSVQVTDNCDDSPQVTFGESVEDEGDCPTDGYLQILRCFWTATDACGNSSVFEMFFVLLDTTPPSLSGCPADLTVDCNQVPEPAQVTAVDNCDADVPVAYDEVVDMSDCPYTITRTWTAEDDCGNTSVCTQVITVEDNEAPVLSGVPDDLTLECSDQVPDAPLVTATDNCDADVPVHFDEVLNGTDCDKTITRTWTASDDCGNQVGATQTIRVLDTQAPVLSGVPDDTSFACMAHVPIPPVVSASDNCDADVAVEFNEDLQGNDCNAIITRVWTASDDCGNTTTQTQTITVLDDTPPTLTGVPADASYDCLAAVPAPPTVQGEDNCDPDVQIDFDEAFQGDSCNAVITRTWTASDDCGNATVEVQTITVLDEEAPTLTGVPADLTIACYEEVPDLPNVTAEDNCTAHPELTFVEVEDASDPCEVLIKRTWTASDDCGNTASAVQFIHIVDEEGPAIQPTDPGMAGLANGDTLTLACDAVIVVDPDAVIVTDACSELVQVEFQELVTHVGDCEADGFLYILRCGWIATDECGNQSTFFVYLKIVDEVPPMVMGVPDDVTVECDSVPDAPSITAMDNCDDDLDILFSEVIVPGDCPNTYLLRRIWTAVDDCGNATEVEQQVHVEDNTPPVLTGLPADLTVDCRQVPAPENVGAEDNCDLDPLIEFSETIDSSGCPRILKRTWTAVDACGNSSSHTQTLTITDDEAPVLLGVPADITVPCDSVPFPAPVTASDNCDADVSLIFEEEGFGTGCDGRLVRTWTAVDACGNTTTAVQTVHLFDNVPPVLSAQPADTVVHCDGIPDPPAITAADNCDTDVPVTFEEQRSDDCPQIITRMWMAVDHCNNMVMHVQVITVVDQQPPELVGVPGDTVVSCGEVPPVPPVTAVDECDPDPQVVFDELLGQGGCQYTIKRIWSAVDACGNNSVAQQTITIVDDEAPTLSFSNPLLQGLENGDTLELDCAHLDVFDETDAFATDNCDPDPQVMFMELPAVNGDCDQDGFLVELVCTWTAKDDCGNENSITLVIRIVDENPPYFNSVPDDLTLECGDPLPTDQPVAADSCTDVTLSVEETSSPGTCPVVEVLVYTWTAVDECGNSATASRTITIEDHTAPVLNGVPDDLTVDADNGETVPPPANVSALDDCDLDPTLDFAESETQNECRRILTRTWTAVDECGNSVSASQTITVLDNQLQVSVATTDASCTDDDGSATLSPDHLSYEWSDGGSGAVRTDLASGNYIVTATSPEGCFLALTVDIGFDCQCQPPVLDTLIVTDASCGEPNGSALIELQGDEALYEFHWLPDLGTPGTGPNMRTDLPAGTYLVTIQFLDFVNCEDKVEVVIGSSDDLEITVLSQSPETCDGFDGSVSLAPVDATYTWSDGGSGAVRNDLSAGTYTVTATLGGNCTDVLDLTVEQDCPGCPSILPDTLIEVQSDVGTVDVCLPIPVSAAQNYDIVLDGDLYDLPLEGCGMDSVKSYSYAIVPNQVQQGPYGIFWQVNGNTLIDTVENAQELADVMSQFDPSGDWFDDAASFLLIGGNTATEYSDLLVTYFPTQQTATLQENNTLVPMGTEITVTGEGSHTVVFYDSDSGCTDTVLVELTVEPVAPSASNLLASRFGALSYNCNYTQPSFCLEIPFAEWSNYKLTNNASPYAGSVSPCNFLGRHSYSFVTLPGAGQPGGWLLESWELNGRSHSGAFASLQELVELMNQWDATGDWTLDPLAKTIEGGGALSNYGPMHILHLGSGASAILEVNTSFQPNATSITLPAGTNELVLTRLSDGVSDTLMLMVACVEPSYLESVIEIGQQDTICLALDELMGQWTELHDACEDPTGAAEFEIIPGTNCVRCLGVEEGFSSACLVICDEYGICDSTFVEVEVRAAQQNDLKYDTLVTQLNRPIMADVLANDFLPRALTAFNIVREPLHGTLTVNPDYTLTYTPDPDFCNDGPDGEPEVVMYEACTAEGCQLALVFITVECGELVIYSGFSPNGDGVNDFFRIEGLGRYPEHKLCIFNRWGTRIFCTENYRNDWDGTWNGKDLPDDTYFYLLDLGDGQRLSGYLQINR